MSDVKPHPIVLENILFTRNIVIAIPGHKPDGRLKEGPTNSLGVQKDEKEPRRYSATMRALMNEEADPKFPYTIDMECIAVFTADDTLSEEEALRGVYITANSVLYGAIRESVAWITGRQPYGPLVLGLSVIQPPAKTPEPAK